MSLKRLKPAILVAAVLLLLLVIWFGTSPTPVRQPPKSPLLNPLYAKYNFGEDASVIDIGIQPLWLPPGIISEVMRRDQLLKKALADRNIEIRFHPFLKGSDVNAFMAEGHLEAGIGGDMPALLAAANQRVQIHSLVQYGFCSIVSRRKGLLAESLRGKRLGIGFGSNAHYVLLDALASVGMNENDIHPVFMDVTEMPQALASGTIDAFSAWEPTPSIAKKLFPDQDVIYRGLSSGFLYFAEEFADDYPDVLRDIVEAETRAAHWLQSAVNLRKACEWLLNDGNSFSSYLSVLSVSDCMEIATDDMLCGYFSVCCVTDKYLQDGGRLSREFQFLKDQGVIEDQHGWSEIRERFNLCRLKDAGKRKDNSSVHTFDYGETDHDSNIGK